MRIKFIKAKVKIHGFECEIAIDLFNGYTQLPVPLVTVKDEKGDFKTAYEVIVTHCN